MTWGAPGAARGGPLAVQSFSKNMRWLTELDRHHEGSGTYQYQIKEEGSVYYFERRRHEFIILARDWPRREVDEPITSRVLQIHGDPDSVEISDGLTAEGWKGGEEALLRQRLRTAFDRIDRDNSGFLDRKELASSLAAERCAV